MPLKSVHQPNYKTEDVKNQHASKAGVEPKFEDSQLWKEFQSGNEAAFAQIYRDNVPLLYNYGLKLIKDKNLVKDCIQNLFIEIWDAKHRLGNVKSIKSYLIKSLRRKVISETVRSRRLHDNAKFTITSEQIVQAKAHSLAEKQEFDLQKQHLKEAVKKLTDRQREIIYLKYYALLSYAEIAEIMSLSNKGTYKLMGRAIHFLRKYMGAIPLLIVSTLQN
ncbi:RNA polymerase sigma factor [Flagellimonas algicola]|uniref:Sigma-70 family RNA polymerase sigma factor n=1 Tax=Flagellimonas algicola TaxID=2583815 RepID=A0ABY2WNH5_9FLAO|nr:sigma-70 family RNA polymerase sigma factor [Allomuricauda algicola]TMU56552.1 sigma-70 family RNA polymerase sigma factor [Allomuricauda algicola]